jgi:hypothetical protein
MSRYAAVLLCLGTVLFAATANFGFTHRFILKKDQTAVVQIKKDYPKTYKKEGILTFRWTLYQNRRLVLLVDYEGFKQQHVLMTLYGRESVKIFLTGDYKRLDRRPFVLLTFDAFDEKKRVAKITAAFSDPQKRLEIKILKPKR